MTWLRRRGTDEEAAAEPDSPERFAADLRALRRQAGDPTLAALDRQTGISKSVLSDAFAGKALPTERTVEGIAAALGVDPAGWLDRRRALDAGSRPARPTPSARPATVRRRTAVWVAVGCFAAGAAGATGVTWAVVGQAGPAAAAARVTVAAGDDPANTPCVDDAIVAASVTRDRDTQLQIVYSDECHAAWARVTRYDDAAAGNTVSASIYRQIAPTAADRQDTTEPDAQSAYTTLIVRDSPQTRLCAVGSITVGGQTIDLGEPICL